MKERINNIDILTGILIIWMILVHASSMLPQILHTPKILNNVLSFFMCWFFFKSGLLFKPKNAIEAVKSNARSLLKPFLKYSIAGYILIWLMYFAKGFIKQELPGVIDKFHNSFTDDFWQLIHDGSISYNAPLWFLLSLFLTKVIYNYLYNKGINDFLILFISLFCSSIIFLYKLDMPLYIGNTMLGLFFYVGGILYNKIKNYTDNRYIYISLFVICCFILIFYPSNVDFRINMTTSGNYFFWIIYSLFGCILSLKLFSKAHSRLLCFIGRNSLYFYVWHWIILVYIKNA